METRPDTRLAVVVLALVAVAGLAGCLGVETLGGDRSDGTGPPHDAPRPGFLDDGAIADGDELFGATEALLADRAHHVELVNTTVVPDADGSYVAGRFLEVERTVGRDGAVLAEREVVDASGDAAVERNATYYRPADASRVWVRRNGSTVDRIPLERASPPVTGLPLPYRGRWRILTLRSVERTRVIEAGDAFALTIDALPDDGTGYALRAVVGSDGVVYDLRLEEKRAARDARRVTWQLRDVGSATVDRPAWVPANGSAGS